MPKVSVIIPTMPGREAMLEKLKSTIPSNCEVIVVGDTNLLLAAKRNNGARKATGDFLFFIDDDNYLAEGALQTLVGDMNGRSEIGVMGMMACYDDKKMRVADGGSYRSLWTGFTEGRFTNDSLWCTWPAPYPVSEVANAFMIKRHVFEEAGGFDEENFPIDLDEADICLRIRRMGYRVFMHPRAICYHKSQTYSMIPDFRRPMNAYFMGRNRILFQKKHLRGIPLTAYFMICFPIFVLSYTACLLWRRKPGMVVHFLKGVWDGLLGRKKNQYQ